MLEPSDIHVSFQPLHPRPGPRPEPPDFSKGAPQFLGRYNDIQYKNVGDTYEDIIRMKGERDITIVFAEQNPYDTSSWRELKRFTIGENTAGFQLSFTVQRRHNAGRHAFRYTAENSKGKVQLERVLIINQRTVGG